MGNPSLEPAPGAPATPPPEPAAFEPTMPLPAPPAAASRWSRAAALVVDVLVLALLPGLPRIVAAVADALEDRTLMPDAWARGAVPGYVGLGLVLAYLGAQAWLTASRGRSLGRLVTGTALVNRLHLPPGWLRGVLLRVALPSLAVLGAGFLLGGPLAAELSPEKTVLRLHEPQTEMLFDDPLLVRLSVSFGLLLAWLLLDGAGLLSWRGRSLSDRLAGTRLVVREGEERRAFRPPRFSSAGFIVSLLGLLAAGTVFVVAAALLSRVDRLESTDLDVPALIAGVLAVFTLIASGGLAAFKSRRFVVGELALVALLTALLAFELMALRVVTPPAMQRFEMAGWLDWLVYSVGAYFALVVFQVIGSAAGFMISSDDGADTSVRFEWLVARRHLRLKLRHYALLAFIATLLPVLVYGVLVWPVLAAWRLMRGEPAPRPLPPTVFMSLLTIVGVMFGVMSLIVVLSVMGGFERDLKEKILGTNAHGLVTRYVGEFTEWREVQKKVSTIPGVRGVTPFILSEVMITTDEAVSGAVLKGIDIETVGQVTDLARNIDSGRLTDLQYPDRIPDGGKGARDGGNGARDGGNGARDGGNGSRDGGNGSRDGGNGSRDGGRDGAAKDGDQEGAKDGAAEAERGDEPVLPGIVIGREMAHQLRVLVGDRLTIMNPLGELGPQGPIPRSRVFRVAAIFYSGMYEFDSKFAYIQLRDAQRFFRLGDAVSGLELRFDNVEEARPLMRRIISALGSFPYQGKDWGEMNKNLFSALRLERVVMFILLSFQVLIACICVIATLVMLVVEKRKEVATLKAMGAREGSIMKLFVLEGLAIGAIGTAYGLAAGYLFCKLIEWKGVNLDPEVYYITHLPVIIDPVAFASVALIAMVLVFVATIYPARRGGSIVPVEGFRDE